MVTAEVKTPPKAAGFLMLKDVVLSYLGGQYISMLNSRCLDIGNAVTDMSNIGLMDEG